MCSCPVLKSPDFTKEFVVQVDASVVGIGAVLAQGDAGEERPIAYLSRKLLPRDSILHSGEGRPGDQMGIGEPPVLPAGKGVYP